MTKTGTGPDSSARRGDRATVVLRDTAVLTGQGLASGIDIVVRGSAVVDVGRRLHIEGEHVEIHASGASVMRLVEQVAVDHGADADPHIDRATPATFAVVRNAVPESGPRAMLVLSPSDLVAVLVDGEVLALDGEPLREPGPRDRDELERFVGAWHDDRHRLVQHLRPDGRYSETRRGHVDAYTGRYWPVGDRLAYLDDTGFWAFGQRVGALLLHAGFVMDRRSD